MYIIFIIEFHSFFYSHLSGVTAKDHIVKFIYDFQFDILRLLFHPEFPGRKARIFLENIAEVMWIAEARFTGDIGAFHGGAF